MLLAIPTLWLLIITFHLIKSISGAAVSGTGFGHTFRRRQNSHAVGARFCLLPAVSSPRADILNGIDNTVICVGKKLLNGTVLVLLGGSVAEVVFEVRNVAGNDLPFARLQYIVRTVQPLFLHICQKRDETSRYLLLH